MYTSVLGLAGLQLVNSNIPVNYFIKIDINDKLSIITKKQHKTHIKIHIVLANLLISFNYHSNSDPWLTLSISVFLA